MDFTFTFTEQEVNILLAGLGELQAKVALQLIMKVQNEAQKQLNSQKKEPKLEQVDLDKGK